ncbi:MAG: SRPBCC domain-containing protein [Caldilineaceae bacterium]
MEAKKGGVWRYIQRSREGDEIAFNGVYHEIVTPERIISTFEFEGWAGNVGLIVTTFAEQEGQTLLKELSIYPSVEARDATVASGMEGGAIESLDRFEEVLARS